VDVFEVPLRNRPGELARLSRALGDAGVNILYTFGAAGGTSTSRVYVRASSDTKARQALERFVADKTVTA
jgi:hypothetical protein